MASLYFSLLPPSCLQGWEFPCTSCKCPPIPAMSRESSSIKTGKIFQLWDLFPCLKKHWGPPGGQKKNRCSAAILNKQRKTLITHIFDYHNTITQHAWHRVVTHVWSGVAAIKAWISWRWRHCVCWTGPGPAQGQASCTSLSPLLSRLLCSQCYQVATPSSPAHYTDLFMLH